MPRLPRRARAARLRSTDEGGAPCCQWPSASAAPPRTLVYDGRAPPRRLQTHVLGATARCLPARRAQRRCAATRGVPPPGPKPLSVTSAARSRARPTRRLHWSGVGSTSSRCCSAHAAATRSRRSSRASSARAPPGCASSARACNTGTAGPRARRRLRSSSSASSAPPSSSQRGQRRV